MHTTKEWLQAKQRKNCLESELYLPAIVACIIENIISRIHQLLITRHKRAARKRKPEIDVIDVYV